jgi:hypothetical protein
VRGLLIVTVVVIGVAALGCAGSDDEASQGRIARLDPARLRELELTYEIPALVREACAGARRQATVRVVCPPLIPDVPLTNSPGLWGSVGFSDEPRFYMLSFNNGGLPGGKRHWIVGGGKASVVGKVGSDRLHQRGRGRPRARSHDYSARAPGLDLPLSAAPGRWPQRRPLGRVHPGR